MKYLGYTLYLILVAILMFSPLWWSEISRVHRHYVCEVDIDCAAPQYDPTTCYNAFGVAQNNPEKVGGSSDADPSLCQCRDYLVTKVCAKK